MLALSVSELHGVVDDAMLGNYVDRSDPDANQKYTVTLSLTRNGSDLAVRLVVLWEPGVSCEINNIVPANNVTKTTDPQGNPTYSVKTNFEDSFLNQGTLLLTVNGSTSEVKLIAREAINTRATRQYGTCTLAR